MIKIPLGDDPVVFDMLVVVMGNGLNPGLWKIDVLCYKVKAADGQSHCHNIWVDLIAHPPVVCQTFIVIYEMKISRHHIFHSEVDKLDQ